MKIQRPPTFVAAAVLATCLVSEVQDVSAEVQIGGQAQVNIGVQPPPPPAPRFRRRPGPRLMAPLHINIGGIGANSSVGGLSGAEASVGVHWASLAPVPTNFDIGVGVLGIVMNDSGDRARVSTGGVYAEFGKRLSGGQFWRTWASGRAELLESEAFGERTRGIGASARLEAEVFLSGVGIAPNGIFLGTYALGLYVEAGARKIHNDVSLLQVGLGITVRTPLVWTW